MTTRPCLTLSDASIADKRVLARTDLSVPMN